MTAKAKVPFERTAKWARAEEAHRLREDGMTVPEIQRRLLLSRAAVGESLAYYDRHISMVIQSRRAKDTRPCVDCGEASEYLSPSGFLCRPCWWRRRDA